MFPIFFLLFEEKKKEVNSTKNVENKMSIEASAVRPVRKVSQ